MNQKSKSEIKIKHQITREEFSFEVANSSALTTAEVKQICNKMNVTAVLVNGKYYSL